MRANTIWIKTLSFAFLETEAALQRAPRHAAPGRQELQAAKVPPKAARPGAAAPGGGRAGEGPVPHSPPGRGARPSLPDPLHGQEPPAPGRGRQLGGPCHALFGNGLELGPEAARAEALPATAAVTLGTLSALNF